MQDDYAPKRQAAVDEGQHLDHVPNARGQPLLHRRRGLGGVELGRTEPCQRRDGHEEDDDSYPPIHWLTLRQSSKAGESCSGVTVAAPVVVSSIK